VLAYLAAIVQHQHSPFNASDPVAANHFNVLEPTLEPKNRYNTVKPVGCVIGWSFLPPKLLAANLTT
jgi:hypothetical protein